MPFLQHFVSERKYDEDLGRVARFTCDVETLKKSIDSFGQGERERFWALEMVMRRPRVLIRDWSAGWLLY